MPWPKLVNYPERPELEAALGSVALSTHRAARQRIRPTDSRATGRHPDFHPSATSAMRYSGSRMALTLAVLYVMVNLRKNVKPST